MSEAQFYIAQHLQTGSFNNLFLTHVLIDTNFMLTVQT